MNMKKRKNICGLTVKARRLKIGLTQLELSDRLRTECNVAIDRAGIAKIETDARCVLDYELLAIAKALRTGIKKIVELA